MSEFKNSEIDISFVQENGEEIFAENSGDGEDIEFDLIIGALEDVLMEGQLSSIQREFCEKHCAIFEDSEENKLEYTEIFRQYTELVENNLEAKMQAKIPGFNMTRFESLLKRREEEEISGDIFDMLLTFGDFNEFKQYMLSVKRGGSDLNLCIESRRLIPEK